MPKTNIVLIHGMWCGSWVWRGRGGFGAALEAQGFDCLAPDLPYHDVDPREAPDPRLGTMSLLDYAAALEPLLRSLDKRPVLVGHSMGGLLAQMLATRGLAEKLVLLAPAAPAGIVSLSPSVIKSFMSIHLTSGGFWRSPIRQTFEEAAYSMLHLLPPRKQREVFDRFVYESGRAAAESGYWPFDPRGASRVDAASVRCPVLCVTGAEDRITPARVVRQVARRYAAAYRELPGHAHWLLGEPGWEEIAEYVGNWIAGH